MTRATTHILSARLCFVRLVKDPRQHYEGGQTLARRGLPESQGKVRTKLPGVEEQNKRDCSEAVDDRGKDTVGKTDGGEQGHARHD